LHVQVMYRSLKIGWTTGSASYLVSAMKGVENNPGGRPRLFDKDQALDIAMRLFWRHGYEGVGIADLTEAIGIAPPSIYAAFGSKAELFRESLRRYEQISNFFPTEVFRTSRALPEAIRAMLAASVRAVTSPQRERGCMISSGLIAAHPEHSGLVQELASMRKKQREVLAEALTPWTGRRQGKQLARYLSAVMQGISIQARDGATPAELMTIVEETVRGLEARHAGRAASGSC
jgi:AcrR family transcriptional regulator